MSRVITRICFIYEIRFGFYKKDWDIALYKIIKITL